MSMIVFDATTNHYDNGKDTVAMSTMTAMKMMARTTTTATTISTTTARKTAEAEEGKDEERGGGGGIGGAGERRRRAREREGSIIGYDCFFMQQPTIVMMARTTRR